MGTLTVRGSAQKRVSPDTTGLHISLSEEGTKYDDVIYAAERKIDVIDRILKRCDFSEADIKTEDLNIEPYFEGTYREDKYIEVFKGYRYLQNISVKYPLDNDRTNDIITALAGSGTDIAFRISYLLENKQEHSKELLKEAIKDAGEKARYISETSGCHLEDIASIRYSDGGNFIYGTDMSFRSMNTDSASFKRTEFDIDPKEIVIEDFVEITWNITEYRKNRV